MSVAASDAFILRVLEASSPVSCILPQALWDNIYTRISIGLM